MQKSKATAIKKLILCYGNAIKDMVKHDGIEHGGYIAFLCMLSIFPFFIFFTAIASFLSNKFLQELLGENLTTATTYFIQNSKFSMLFSALQPRLMEISDTPPQSFVGIAIFSIIWTASSLLEGLRTTLNRAYRVIQPPSYLFRRFMSILQFILMAFIVVAVVFILKTTPMFLSFISNEMHFFTSNRYYFEFIDRIATITGYFDNLFSDLIIFFFLSYLYYLIPNKKQRFVDTFPGACHTLFGWFISTKIMQYYITVFPQINLVYGSIAGIIIALLHFYVCSVIFIYGAEFNYWCNKIFIEKHERKNNHHSS